MQCYSVHYFSELVCVCVFHTFAHILLLIQSYAYTLLCFSCSKSILKDYADLTDFSTPEHIEIYKRIHDQASSLSPVTEYKVFVDQNKWAHNLELMFGLRNFCHLREIAIEMCKHILLMCLPIWYKWSAFRSDKLTSSNVEFDSQLLMGYNGTLKENQLALDTFTLEHVQQRLVTWILNSLIDVRQA